MDSNTTAIKMLHFADVHIGMENYGNIDPLTGTSTRVADFLNRLDEVIDYAIENNADLTVFAGDAFKDRDPEITQQREFASRIKRLAAHCPTLLLVGNHDMPGLAAKANSMDIFTALDVNNVIVGNNPEGRVIETKNGPIYLAWLPYPMRNRALTPKERHGKSIDEIDVLLQRAIVEILERLASDASKHDMPRVLSAHLSVLGAEFGSERLVMLGHDATAPLKSICDPVWDYVALGHIHKHQVLNEDSSPLAIYSGSLERIDFGEKDDPKGFCWIELDGSENPWQFIEVDSRKFLTITVDIKEGEDATSMVLNKIGQLDIAERVVKLIVKMSPSQQADFRDAEITSVLSEAFNTTVERRVESEIRTRLGDLEPERLSPIELLGHYFQSKGEPDESTKILLDKAKTIMDLS
jgi:exonuclease SbcD